MIETKRIFLGIMSKFYNIESVAKISICIHLPKPMSIFKRSTAGLNLKFSFSWISCFTKNKKLCVPYYLPIVGWREEKDSCLS